MLMRCLIAFIFISKNGQGHRCEEHLDTEGLTSVMGRYAGSPPGVRASPEGRGLHISKVAARLRRGHALLSAMWQLTR